MSNPFAVTDPRWGVDGTAAGLGQTGAEAPIEEHSRRRGSQLNGFSTCWLRERGAEVLIHIRGFEVDVFAAE
jgi:hypothetical protein